MATPKLRCGATTSSISADSGMRSNGSPLDDSSVSLARISRQRVACSRSSRTSSPCGASARDRVLQFLGDHRDGRQRRAELVRGGGGEPVELREMLLARQHQFGGGQRVGELARFLGDLPGVDADEADARAGSRARRPSCRSAADCSGSSLSQGSG